MRQAYFLASSHTHTFHLFGSKVIAGYVWYDPQPSERVSRGILPEAQAVLKCQK